MSDLKAAQARLIEIEEQISDSLKTGLEYEIKDNRRVKHNSLEALYKARKETKAEIFMYQGGKTNTVADFSGSGS